MHALLAKAESTQYDEEAEALSAKAQELISRYALEQLMAAERSQTSSGVPEVEVRRLWIDPPYVGAKARLVHAVASANRCQAASTEALAFCTVVGSPTDLDAVELLVTSLLVQASAAMTRHGSRVSVAGRSRTRSFRHSFLVAYAQRIGERLCAVTEEVATDSSGALLPVLRGQEARVAEAFDAMVPHRLQAAPTVSNADGWYAGRAAADLATLSIEGRLVEQWQAEGA